MTEKITRWALGTAQARVTGDAARFINVAVRSGIELLEVEKTGDDALILLRAAQYKRLHAIKLRTHTRVRLVKKRGLPFIRKKALRRPGFLLGAALGIALFYYLSGFYWGIELEGESPYSRRELLQAAESCGAYIGAPKSKFEPVTASKEVVNRLPRLAWASLNTDGCFITLCVRPALEEVPGAEHEGAFDIVASRAGLVRSITAESGTVLVRVGSAVGAGQVLVSGVTQIGDPYDEQPMRNLLSHARAEVIAETLHTFTASCPLMLESYREVTRGERKALCVLGVRIPLGFFGAPETDTAAYTRETLSLLGKELPVWVETLRTADFEPVTVELDETQARARAYEKVRELRDNYLGEERELLSEKVTYSVKDGAVYARAECVCLENIAREVSISEGI